MSLGAFAQPNVGKLPASLQTSLETGLDRGEAQEILVVFDTASIGAQAKGMRQARHLAHDDEAIVQFKAQRYSEKKKVLERILALDRKNVLHDYSHLPIQHIRVGSRAMLAQILAHPGVKAVTVSRKHKLQLTKSLPLIEQPQALVLGASGQGTSVAVLDTGVDFTNSAFGSCTNAGPGCKVVYAQDFAPNDYEPDADAGAAGHGHGTNVAAIVLGVAPKANILALDVFRTDGYAYTADIVAAINWVIAHKSAYNAVAMNMSFGDNSCDGLVTSGGCSAPMTDPANAFKAAIDEARNAGVISVIASGNDSYTGAIDAPAAVDTAVSVGAVYDSGANLDQVAGFANSASFLSMLAPGVDITAAGITYSGTSQATPHVAGAVAALRSLYPNETVNQIIARLKSGVPVTDARNGIVTPRLDMLGAMGVDIAPDSVLLTDQTGVAPGANIESAPITVSGLSGPTQISISSPGQFAVNGDGFGNVTATVVNGDVVRVRVLASSTAGGTASTTLSIGALSDTFNVTTASAAVPAVQFSMASLPFGAAYTGGSLTRSVTITNGGNGTLSGITPSIAPADAFSLGSTTCSSTLPAGTSCTLDIVFSPSATGAQSANLSLASNAPSSPYILPLSGTGTTPAALNVALDASGSSFTTGGDAGWFGQTATSHSGGSAARSGRVNANQSSWMETTITGPGDGSFWWKVSSEFSYDFLSFYVDGVQMDTISGAVDWTQKKFSVGSGSHVLRWTYAKDQFYSSGADAGWVDGFSFTGGQAAISLSSTPLSFGSVAVGSSASMTEVLTNNGTVDLMPASTSVSGEGFSVTADTCSGASIAPGAACSIGVRYTPADPGAASGTLSISSNAPGSPLAIPLDASGTALSSLGSALDNTTLSFTTSPSAPWFAQDSVTRVAGNNAAQSGQSGNLDTSWLETTVTGPGTLSFYWKTSSAGNTDSLVVMVDGQPAEMISGENDWEQRSLDIGGGSHTIRWAYIKTSRYAYGADAAWLDQVSFTPLGAPAIANLALALDTPSMGWQSANIPGNTSAWVGQNTSTYSGDSAAVSPQITPGLSSTLRTLVTGPGTLNFYWRVSSDFNKNNLCVQVGAAKDCNNGVTTWEAHSLSIPAGLWPVDFLYTSANGSDQGYVDFVAYTRADVALPTALDNSDLVFETVPTVPWYGETAVTAVGTSAVQTPPVLDNQRSWIKTSVTGPGTLSFRWKVSSEATFDFLRFYVDGVESPTVQGISGEAGWVQASVNIGSGTHRVGWQYEKDNYTPGGQDTAWLDGVTFGAPLSSQSITFGDPPSLVYGGTATVSATATSNLPVSFSSTTPTVCSVSGTTVTALAVGSCTVAANQAGNASYAAAPQVTQNLSVGQASQSISFGSAPSLVYGGTGTVSATATSNLPVSFSSTTPTVCSVSGTTVTALAVGSCTVAANQAGNASYAAAPQVTQNLSVGQASQSISFGSAPSLVYGGTATVSATATSNLPVSFSSTTPTICSVSGTSVTALAVGSCTVAANQAGNASYAAAP
ncbi:MAG: choice-of-anchor D domain-containing protein, partial [Rhodocyclaceae bacterium]|nr:choice-of-anchor D domain-containing protein [Rhodocyclaceae bacterium]